MIKATNTRLATGIERLDAVLGSRGRNGNAASQAAETDAQPATRADASGLMATDLRRDADPAWAAHVVEANEQLILSALHAEKMAETAVHDLDELTRAMQRDALTDTPNRALMLDRLEHAVAVARRNQSCIAVLFVDLDDFKQINDTRGHSVGDEVLKSVARAIESVVRRSDTVSRHGGDEFLVLLAEISHPAAAALIATKMLSAIAAPLRVGEDLFCLSASIGIAVFPDDGDDASALIHCADKAMYRSKREARGQYAFHHIAGFGAGHPGSDDSRQSVAVGAAAALSDQLDDVQERGRCEGARHRLNLHAKIASVLRSSLTSTQERLDLLHQVEPTEPLLQLLIEKEIASLSAPAYESFDSPRVRDAKFTRFETVKTGQFDAVADDGARYTVLEFTVTSGCGEVDQTRRSLTAKSFGLANGERIDRLNFSQFQISGTGVKLHRC